MSPGISIVIPVFNVGPYIEKCVQSILLSNLDVEIFLVDDGSVDNSAALCSAMAQNHSAITFLEFAEKRGCGGGRNRGMDLSTKKYIAFVDGDDWVDHTVLEGMIHHAERTKADIVFSGISRIDENDIVTPWTKIDSELTLVKGKSVPSFIDPFVGQLTACDKIYRRTLFLENAIRFPENVNWEDTATTPKLYARANIVAFYPGTYYYYLRRTSGSMTTSFSNKHIDDLSLNLDQLLAWFQANEPDLVSSIRRYPCLDKFEDMQGHVLSVDDSSMKEYFYQVFGSSAIDYLRLRIELEKQRADLFDHRLVRRFANTLNKLRRIKQSFLRPNPKGPK